MGHSHSDSTHCITAGVDDLVGRETESIWRTHQMLNWPVISLNATVFHIAYENRNKIPIKLLIQQIFKILHSLDVFKYKFKFMEIADKLFHTVIKNSIIAIWLMLRGRMFRKRNKNCRIWGFFSFGEMFGLNEPDSVWWVHVENAG